MLYQIDGSWYDEAQRNVIATYRYLKTLLKNNIRKKYIYASQEFKNVSSTENHIVLKNDNISLHLKYEDGDLFTTYYYIISDDTFYIECRSKCLTSADVWNKV